MTPPTLSPHRPLVRPAELRDAPRLVAGNIAMALETEGRELDPARVGPGVDAVLRDSAKGRYFIAEIAGAVVGQLLVTTEWSDWRNGTFWWIQSVYVWPDFRGRGVYKALHDWIETRARADPTVCGLRLYVEGANARAQAVYARHGMHRTDYRLYEIDFGTSPG